MHHGVLSLHEVPNIGAPPLTCCNLQCKVLLHDEIQADHGIHTIEPEG